MNQKHEFAMYLTDLDSIIHKHTIGDVVSIADSELYHRLINILRLKEEEPFILFNAKTNASCQLKEHSKNRITFALQAISNNPTLTPSITFLLPILKRENFDSALYNLAELGVQYIQPVITEKTQRSWGNAKDLARAQQIIISAAEQSKNFSLPIIKTPKELEDCILHLDDQPRIYFDVAGNPLADGIAQLKAHTLNKLVLMVGPEADLTIDEKEFLRNKDFDFYRLTPTILRAHQAVAVAVGALRSLL